MNILLVEDEGSVAGVIVEIMLMWGHHIQWSPTGSDAIQRSRGVAFDLILLDISLPDIQGHKLTPFFKELQPQAGIVIMTGNNSQELEATVRKEGVIYYMIKPFKLRVLKEVVDHASNRRVVSFSYPEPKEMGEVIAGLRTQIVSRQI